MSRTTVVEIVATGLVVALGIWLAGKASRRDRDRQWLERHPYLRDLKSGEATKIRESLLGGHE